MLAALMVPILPAISASPPLRIAEQGAFEAGGKAIGTGPATQSCDHGHVEYQIPDRRKAVSMFLWHSSSTSVWQRRWDGGEGFQSLLLRMGYPVYLWDGPRVGRGNWGCAPYAYQPVVGQDQQNFVAWRLGAKYPDFFPGVQFPVGDANAWDQATRARYQEFDTTENARLEATAAARALDRIGPTILVTNSAGGMRALLTAIESNQVKAIVAYENPGFVFPDDVRAPDRPTRFGPVIVSARQFERLTRIPMQFVFGDNIDQSPAWSGYLQTCEEFVRLVNARGGKAEILRLPSRGLRGNTHIPFADLNNAAVARLLQEFIKRYGLNRRVDR